MTVKRMKSDQVRVGWKDVLQYVRQGGTVVVEHYTEAIADVRPHTDSLEAIADDTGASRTDVLTALDDLITRHGPENIVVSEEDGTVTANAGVVIRSMLGSLTA